MLGIYLSNGALYFPPETVAMLIAKACNTVVRKFKALVSGKDRVSPEISRAEAS